MSKSKTPALGNVRRFDPEIDRLLYVSRIIGALINRSHTLLEPHEFPQSIAAIAALAETFTREFEASLLQAYDRTATKQTLS
jgi:hypothetical protein